MVRRMADEPWEILVGDCREVLRTLPRQSVQTCVTSPPYFGLRDYGTGEWEGGDAACDHKGGARQSAVSTLVGNGHGGDKPLSPYLQGQTKPMGSVCTKCGASRVDRQIGLEPTPDEFVEALVEVFREVRRVLRDDGTVWLNLGDSYNSGGRTSQVAPGGVVGQPGMRATPQRPPVIQGVKQKDLVGIPWIVAFALRADGWYLRSDIVWHKPNPMPESVTDRPTRSHEFIFLLSKRPRYYYDADAIREQDSGRGSGNGFVRDHRLTYQDADGGRGNTEQWTPGGGRNKRDVWTVASKPYSGAHFATFPPDLIEPCVLAGAPVDGVVLDPFNGAGTTGMVAVRNRRRYIGVELNPDYAQMARDRIETDVRLGGRPPVQGSVLDGQSSLFDAL